MHAPAAKLKRAGSRRASMAPAGRRRPFCSGAKPSRAAPWARTCVSSLSLCPGERHVNGTCCCVAARGSGLSLFSFVSPRLPGELEEEVLPCAQAAR